MALGDSAIAPMKTNLLILKARIRILMLLCATIATLLTVARAAQAGYVVTLKQIGADIVATGSGAIDLTGLQGVGLSGATAKIQPVAADIFTGATVLLPVDVYVGGSIGGPGSFGSGFGSLASSGSGDLVGISGIFRNLFVPPGYVSGTALSDTATYNNATFSSLGVTPGRYKWTWGTGANQNFTLNAGAVPDSDSTFGLLLLGLAALLGAGRLRLTPVEYFLSPRWTASCRQ